MRARPGNYGKLSPDWQRRLRAHLRSKTPNPAYDTKACILYFLASPKIETFYNIWSPLHTYKKTTCNFLVKNKKAKIKLTLQKRHGSEVAKTYTMSLSYHRLLAPIGISALSVHFVCKIAFSYTTFTRRKWEILDFENFEVRVVWSEQF